MKCILTEDLDSYDLKSVINKEIVQKDIRLKEIYDGIPGFNYKFMICIKEDKCIGILPFILYENKIANIINSMPFIGYGGVSVKNDENNKIFRFIINSLIEYAENNNISLVTICTQPFESEKYELYKKYFKPDFERKNFHQYINLNNYKLENVKRRIKRSVRKCTEKYGVKIIESNDLNNLKYWYQNIYLERLSKTGCAIYPYSVFEGFIKNINQDRVRMIYGIMNDEIIGGGLFLNQGKSLDNFMRVIGTDFLDTQVGTYIDYYSIEYAINTGIPYYNWQSCDYIGSNIFKYKSEWGSEVGYHHYLTKVTGDILKLKKTPLEIIKEEFKGIYVMPYEEFER